MVLDFIREDEGSDRLIKAKWGKLFCASSSEVKDHSEEKTEKAPADEENITAKKADNIDLELAWGTGPYLVENRDKKSHYMISFADIHRIVVELVCSCCTSSYFEQTKSRLRNHTSSYQWQTNDKQMTNKWQRNYWCFDPRCWAKSVSFSLARERERVV